MLRRSCIMILVLLGCVSLTFAGNGRDDVPISTFLELAAAPELQCVGEVIRDGSFVGSGVMIDSLHVLSAAHVFLDDEREPDTIMQGERMIIVFVPKNIRPTASKNLSVVFGVDTIQIVSFELHPDYLASKRSKADIVMLTLQRPIRGIRSATLLKDQVQTGTEGLIVGCGPLGSASSNERTRRGRCAGWNVIDSVSSTRLWSDMDHPQRPELSVMGSETPHAYEYCTTGGDSGGGIFIQHDGTLLLCGIVSGTSYNLSTVVQHGAYGNETSFTRIDVYLSWIQSISK
jgi:hypothetical protein